MPRLHRTSVAVLTALAVALAATVLAACGSSDSGSSDSSQDAAKLLQETFSGGKAIKSGQLGLTLASRGTGGAKPTTMSLSGPFQSNGTGKVPSFDLTFSFGTQGQAFTVTATSTGTAGYLTVGGTSYVLDQKSFDGFVKGYTSSSSTAGKDAQPLSVLGIDPRDWLNDAKIAGTTQSGGVDTIHVTAGIDVPTLLRDLNGVLGKAKGTDLPAGASVPKKLTAAELAQAQKAVSDVKVDVFTGKSDKVLRRMVISFDLAAPGGKSLYGLGSGRLTLDLTISDLNQPQTITAPKDAQPFGDLQKQLESLVSGVQGDAASGSGSSSGGTSTTDDGADAAASSKYLKCLQKAGQDLAAVQRCASLVGQ